MFEAFEEPFVLEPAELLVHALVSKGERGEVRLEDHLVCRARLEADPEEQVVKDLLVRVRRVGLLGCTHEVEVEVRGDGRGEINRLRGRAAEIPHDAAGARIEARLAEGERLGASGEDGL